MQQDKMNLIEFQRMFSFEGACEEHLFKLRWPGGYKCPRCGNEKYYFHSIRHLYQCSKCKYQVSVTAGTVFHKTRTSLIKWFWLIFLMGRQKSGVSMLSLQQMLEIKSYKTIWMMGHKIRHAMAHRDSYYKLAGLVEIDDTYIGSKKHGIRGRGAKGKSKVIVAVENIKNKPRYAKMESVDKVGGKAILTAFDGHLEVDVVLRPDGFASYKVLISDQRKYEPIIVSSGEDPLFLLHWVHMLISNIKSNIKGIYHGVSIKHIARYLSEFCYRFNRRFWENQMFDRILNAGLNCQTITFTELSQ